MTETHKTITPYGSWASSIHSRLLTQKSVRLGEPKIHKDTVFWLESRPEEKGRSVLIMEKNGNKTDLTPPPYSVHSKAHEYGGGSYCLSVTSHQQHNDNPLNSHAYFVNAADQCIYRLNLSGTDTPKAITQVSKRRFADLTLDPQRNRLIAVCEDHTQEGQEPTTYLVAIDIASGKVSTLIEGHDFFSNPSLSPDGQKISWMCWDHPHMPWDRSSCWIGDIDFQGKVTHPQRIAGDENTVRGESIFQPKWGADGSLYFVSDRNNWWNIYRYQRGKTQAITCLDAETATPQWVFGMSCYDFLNDQELLVTATQNGRWQLMHVDLLTLNVTPLKTEWSDISNLHCSGDGTAICIAASPVKSSNLIHLTLNGNGIEKQTTIRQSNSSSLDCGDISQPHAITYATGANNSGEISHGFFYPPANSHHEGPPQLKPPLIVLCHGGPTGATETGLNLKIQYWTNRGFAVADINYRGSTGYGREYREKLNGNWGISDVEDVCAAVDYLTEQALIDPNKVAIKGSSAGGYTVLAALTFSSTFKAGASLYGIGNLETLALDTHKFEARYMDSLVGPYPEKKSLYHERSPLYQADQLSCPVIFFQGLEDKVVPPNQAESMVNRLKEKKVPVAYISFEGEGHGFRQSDSIQRCIEGELSFYSQIFDFDIDEQISPVNIMRDQ